MTWWQITIVLILAWIIYLKTKKKLLNRKAIGQRVVIDYFDQNYNFETIFPIKGTITQIIKIGRQKLFLLDLDEKFDYKKSDFKKIVIAERHVGHYIGSAEEVHIHVLLPKTELNKDKYKIDDFDHVVWATVTPEN